MEPLLVLTTKTTEKRYELKLSRTQILSMLKRAMDHPPRESCSITILVPGGGDWSGERLEIGGSVDLEITWTEREESEA